MSSGALAWPRTAWGSELADTAAELVEEVKADLTDYPLLLERYTALANADPAGVNDASFEFGLRTLLDGLHAHLDS